MINEPAPSVPLFNPGVHRSALDNYSLKDLLKIREDVIGQKTHFIEKYGTKGYQRIIGKIQSWIWYRRTHTKSGLLIPYDKDRVDD